MVDLYVVEGRNGAGKSTLICHLTGVARGHKGAGGASVRHLSLQGGHTVKMLVFYASPNEKQTTPQQLAQTVRNHMHNIDAIVVPLRPRGNNGSLADAYVQILLGLGNINFLGYAQLGRPPFNVMNGPAPIIFPGTPPNPPSNVIAQAVRTNWGLF